METMKNQIKKEDLSVMEELLHQANYQISDLEALCGAQIYGFDAELEVYPPGESYPYYFRVNYHLFSNYVQEWFDENDIYDDIKSDWWPKYYRDSFEEGGVMWWYDELASDQQKIEITNYALQKIFKLIF